MAERGRVLVLGDDNRSCLTIVRSLGRQGLEVWLGPETSESIVPQSRYVRHTVRLPSTKERVDGWLEELETVLRREPFDLVIPSSDNSLVPVIPERARFERLARFAIPDAVGFEHTYLKSKTLALAERVGVPIPVTRLIETAADLAAVRRDADAFPLVIKPVSSKMWRNGSRLDRKVRTARDATGLKMAARLLRTGPVLLQNYFEGRGVGQEFLVSKGEIVDAFQHERVHEPLSGGGSSYRKSVPLDADMLECSKRLLGDLRWTGVAMVEYRKNFDTGAFVLMEINGRFWGSLPLAVASGVDFPYRLYSLLMHPPVPPSPPYRLNLHCRNLSKDMRWFRERRAAYVAGRPGPSITGEIARGLGTLIAGRERFDTFTRDDPKPGIYEIWRGATAGLRKRVKRLRDRSLQGAFALTSGTAAWRQAQGRKLRRLLAANPRILFVCRGNICRSPFAELYARRKLDEAGLTSIETTSAGSYPVVGRSAPDAARQVSKEFGVPLDAHRSTVLELGVTSWAGAILCMDERDTKGLRAAFPETRNRLLYLGAFRPNAREVLIADPWNKPAVEFRKCYGEVATSVDGLIRAMQGAS